MQTRNAELTGVGIVKPTESSSGSSFKLKFDLEEEGIEVNGHSAVTNEHGSGSVNLQLNDALKLPVAMYKETHNAKNGKGVIHCAALKEFSDSELKFLNNSVGHELQISFESDQKEMF